MGSGVGETGRRVAERTFGLMLQDTHSTDSLAFTTSSVSDQYQRNSHRYHLGRSRMISYAPNTEAI